MTMKEPSAESADLALLRATAAGDLQAFERLHRRYHPKVFGFALRLTERFEAAEEVVEDTMMVVWRKASEFRGAARPSTWIFGIAYRIALKARKRLAVDRLHDEIDPDMPSAQGGMETVEMVFERSRVVAALQRLPLQQRATVELTYYHGYRLSEIAEITDCPLGTVKTRMFHARAKLRELLGERDDVVGGER
ncbi:MAG: sigma-70 family RNA polymerase sigma factor [Pseudomonadota bacterium]